MKKLFTILAIISICAATLSCQKEEVYAPSKKIKIQKIEVNGQKLIQWAFEWDKKMLSKIRYYNVADPTNNIITSTYSLSYDKDKMPIEMKSNDGQQIVITNVDKKNTRIDCYNRGTLVYYLTFDYLDKKVEKISFFVEITKLQLLDPNSYSYLLISNVLRHGFESGSKVPRYIGYIMLTYDSGNKNVTTSTEFGLSENNTPIKTFETNYQYDSKNNPYWRMNFAIAVDPVLSYSQNNMTSAITYDVATQSTSSTTYTYTYEKDWPIKMAELTLTSVTNAYFEYE